MIIVIFFRDNDPDGMRSNVERIDGVKEIHQFNSNELLVYTATGKHEIKTLEISHYQVIP